MFDVISIGSALVDVFVKSDEFHLERSDEGVMICQHYGKKIPIDELVVKTGGGGSNTAVGFSRMGFQTGLIAEIGTDTWGKVVLEDLKEEKVSPTMVVSEKREQTGGSVILVGKDGGRTVMVHRGASSLLDPEDIDQEKLSRAGWIHLSSIAGRESALSTIFKTIKRASVEAKANHDQYWKPNLSWNPGKSELELLQTGQLRFENCPCQVLIVNRQEWQMLDWVQSEALDSIDQIVITDGEKGGEVIVDGNSTKFKSSGAESVDDTGAGDAFAVGYVSAMILGHRLEKRISWGVKNASSVIQQVGAKPGLLRKSQL